MSSDAPSIPSPKQPAPERRRDWYAYYAGYSERFVHDVLDRYANGARSVLDPWNGSGTTTAVGAARGLRSSGVDVNPVLTVIAKARLTPRSISDSLVPLGAKIIEHAQSSSTRLSEFERDPLHDWMRRDSAITARAIEGAILGVLADQELGSSRVGIVQMADSLPTLACFYYTALFAAIRDLLRRFRASNPTWMTPPKHRRNRVNPSWETMAQGFTTRVAYFSKRLSLKSTGTDDPPSTIRTGFAARLPFDDATFDSCVTSPPYATRIDYVKSVLPELAVLGAKISDIRTLRRSSLGTPVVSGERPTDNLVSPSAQDLVVRIMNHRSRGSKHYYAPWMATYFIGLQRGLKAMTRAVLSPGSICIVVQDSHYKELHVDLQRIVVEMLESTGRCLVERQDYKVTCNMALMNPRARRYLSSRKNLESLLVFR